MQMLPGGHGPVIYSDTCLSLSVLVMAPSFMEKRRPETGPAPARVYEETEMHTVMHRETPTIAAALP